MTIFASKDCLDGLSVVFDLDGTIVDTAPDIVRSANKALQNLGFDLSDPRVMRAQIAYGARKILAGALEAQGASVEDSVLDELERQLLVEYRQNLALESVPYPGVVEALSNLADSGALLSICTNKRQVFAEALLRDLDLARYFKVVYGGDAVPVKKPHKDHVLAAILGSAGCPQRAIMIGDSEVDVAAARSAGIPVVVVSYGYTAIPPDRLGADLLLDNIALLPKEIVIYLSDARMPQ